MGLRSQLHKLEGFDVRQRRLERNTDETASSSGVS